MDGDDLTLQFEQQRLQLEQLKLMVREKDESLQSKDKELQETNAKLSKLRLQAKAKATKETKAKKAAAAVEEPTDQDGENEAAEKANRAKTMLLKRKLEEKDKNITEKEELLKSNAQIIEDKNKIIQEREKTLQTLATQLAENNKLIEDLQSGKAGQSEGNMEAMYAQIVYKDKNLLEMNNKLLEMERKLIDLQEYISEKNEVIRGRDRVVEILQTSIKDKDQTVNDQNSLIAKLSAKVENGEELQATLKEEIEKANHQLKQETDKFNLRLQESQRYFEESLGEREDEIQNLRKLIQVKNDEISMRDNDLKEIISRHENDIQRIMSKEDVNLEDQVLKMLEQKVKDTNEVLEGKIQMIEVLQKENSEKEKQINESVDVQKNFKEKLQLTSEQLMLTQANLTDMELQWKEEKNKMNEKIRELMEKHDHELSEKDLQAHTIQSQLTQYQTLYSQAMEQYNKLQGRFQQTLSPGGAVPVSQQQDSTSQIVSAELKEKINKMENQLTEKDKLLSEIEKENANFKDKIKELEVEIGHKKEEGGSSGGKSDPKMLKMKAQMTSKIKALEKEVEKLKKGMAPSGESQTLKNDLDTANEKMKQLQKDNDDLQNELLTERSSSKELKDQVNCLQQDLESFKIKTVEMSNEIDSYKSQLSELISQMEDIKQQRESAVDDLEKEKKEQLENDLKKQEKVNKGKDLKLSRVVQESSNQKQASDQVVDELKTQVLELAASLDHERSEKSLLEQRIKKFDEKLLSSSSELANISDPHSSEQSETIIKLTDEKEKLVNECKSIKVEMNKLQKLNKGREAKIKKFQDVMSEQEKLLAAKEADIIVLKENKAELESKIRNKSFDEEEINNLETDYSNLQQRYEQYEMDYRHLEMKCQQLEEDLLTAQSERRMGRDRYEIQQQEQIGYLEEYVESLQRNLHDKDQMAVDMENELLSLRDQERYMIQEKRELENEISKLQQLSRSKDDKITKIFQGHEEHISIKDSTIEKLNYELDDTKFRVEDLEKQLRTSYSEKDELNAELQKVQLLFKGKDAKNKKYEELLSEQDKVVSEKDTEICMLKERMKDYERRMEDILYEEDLARKDMELFRSENYELKDRCYSLEEELTRIQKDFSDKLDESQSEIMRVSEERDSMIESYRQYNETVQNLEYDKETLENVIGERESGISEINEELKDAISDRDKFKAENKKLSALLKGKEVKIKKLEESLTKNKNDMDDMNKTLQEVENEREKFVSEISKLQKLGKSRDVKAKKFEEVVAAQEKVLVDKDTEVVILKEQLNELNVKIDDLYHDEESLRDKLDKSITHAQELEDKCSYYQSEIEKLQLCIDERNDQIELLKKDLDMNIDEIRRLENEKADLLTHKEKLETTYDHYNLQRSDSDGYVQTVKKELESVLVEKEQLNVEMAKLKKLSKGKAAKIAKMEEVLSHQENIISEKEMDVVVLRERVQHLSEKLEYSDQEVGMLSQDLEQALVWKDKYEKLSKELPQTEKQNQTVEMVIKETMSVEAAVNLGTAGPFENIGHESAIDPKQVEIEQLQTMLENEKEKFKQEKSTLESQIKKLKTLCKAKDTKLSKLMSDTESQSSESSLTQDLELQTRELDSTKEILVSKSEKANTQNKENELKLKEFDENMTKLQQENTSKLEEIQTMSSNMLAWEQWYKSELENQKVEIERYKNEEISSLQNTWSSYESWYRQEISNLQTYIANLEGKPTIASETVGSINTDEKALDNTENVALDNIPIVQEQFLRNEAAKTEADPSAQLHIKEEEILIVPEKSQLNKGPSDTAMTEELHNLKSQNAILQSDLASKVTVVEELKNEIKLVRQDNDARGKMVERLNGDIAKMKQEVMKKDDEVEALKDIFEKDIDEFQNNLDALKAQNTQLSADLEAKSQEILSLRTETASQGVWDHDQIAAMETKLGEYENYSAWYKSRIEELEGSVEYLNGVNETNKLELQNDVEELQEELNKARHDEGLYKDMVETLKIEKGDMEKTIKSKDTKVKTMIEAIDDLQDMLSKKENDLQQLVTDKEAKCEEVAQLSSTVNYLQDQLAIYTKQLQQDLDLILYEHLGLPEQGPEMDMNSMLIVVKQEVTKLKDQHTDMVSKMREGEERVSSLETMLSEKNGIIEKEKEHNQTLEMIVKNYEVKLEEKEQAIASMKQNLSHLTEQEDVTDKDQQIHQLESQIARLKDNLSRQGTEMQDLQQLYQNECEQLEKALNALEDCKESYILRLEESETAVSNLRERLNDAETKCHQANETLEERNEYISSMETFKKGSIENQNEMEDMLKERDAQIDSLKASLESLQNDLVKRIEEMKKMQEMYDKQSVEQDKMMNSIEEFNASNAQKLQDKENKITELMQELYGKQQLMEATEASKMAFVKSLKETEQTVTDLRDRLEVSDKNNENMRLELRKVDEKVQMLESDIDRLSLENTTLQQQLRQLETADYQATVAENISQLTSTISEKFTDNVDGQIKDVPTVEEFIKVEKVKTLQTAPGDELHHDISSLEVQIKQLQKDNDSLKEETASLKQQLTNIQEEHVNTVNEYANKLTMQEEEHTKVKDEYANKLSAQQEENAKTIDEYANELAEANEEKNKFQSWSERLEVSFEENKKTIDKLNQSIDDKERCISDFQSQIAELQEFRNKSQQISEELNLSVEQQKHIVESLILSVGEKDKQLSEMQNTIDNLKDVITEKDEEMASLESSSQSSSDQTLKLTELQAYVEKLEHKLAEKDQKMMSLIENLQEEEERLSPLAEENETLAEKLESVNKELKDANSALSEKEEQMEEMKKNLDEKELQFKKALATAKKLKFQLQKIKEEKPEREVSSEGEIVKLKETLQGKEIELESFVKNLESKESQCSELEVKVQTLSDFNSVLETSKVDLTKQVADMQNEYQQLQEKYSEVSGMLKKLQEEGSLEEVTINEKNSEIQILSGKVSENEKLIVEKEKYIIEMEERVNSFEELVQSLQQEVRKQTSQVNGLQNEVSQGQIEKGHLEDEKQSLQKNIEQTAVKIIDLSNQLAFHEENLSQFAHSLKLISPHLHHIDFQNLNQVAEIIKDLIGTSEHEVTVLKQKLDNQDDSVRESTEKEVEELRNAYETKLTNQMEENQSLHSKVSELTNQMDCIKKDFESKLSNQEEEKQLLQSQFSFQLTSMEAEWESKMTEQSAENEVLNNQILDLRNQTSELEDIKSETQSLQQEIISLNSEKLGLRQENNKLFSQIEEFIQEKEEFSNDKANLENTIQKLTEESQKLKDSLEVLANEKEVLQQTVNTSSEELHTSLANITQECQDMKSQIDSLTTQNQDLVLSDSSSKEQLKTCKYELVSVREDRDELEKQFETTRQEVDSLKSEIEEKNNALHQLTELENKSEELSSELKLSKDKENTLTKELETADEKNREMIEEIEKISQQNTELTDKVSVLLEEKGKLKVTINEMSQKKEEVHESMETEHVQSTEMGWGDADWGDTIEKVEVTPLRQTAPEHNQEIQNLKDDVKSLQEKLATSETKSEKMLMKLKVFKAKNQTLQSELDKARQTLKDATNTLENDDGKTDKEITVLKERATNLEEELTNMKSENNNLLHNLETEKVKNERLNTQILELEEKSKKEMETLVQKGETESSKLAELESQNQKLSDNCEILKQERNKLITSLSQASEDTESAKNEMDSLRSEIEMLENSKLESDRQKKETQSLCDELESECKSYREIVANLKQALSKEKEESFHRIKQIQSESGDVSALKGKIAELERENTQLTEFKIRINELETERDEIMEEMDGLREDLINEKKNSKEKMDQLNIEMQSFKSDNNTEELKRDLEKLKVLCKEQQEEREGLDWKLQEMTSLEEEIEDLQKELETSRKEQKIASTEENVKKIKDELERTKTELKKKVDECESLKRSKGSSGSEDRISELEEQLELINEELNEIMTENEKLKSSPENVKAKMYESVQKQFTELAEKYDAMVEENANIKEQFKQKGQVASKDHIDQTERVIELEEQLQVINEELNELMTENEKLKSSPTNVKSQMFDNMEKQFMELAEKYNSSLEENKNLAEQLKGKDVNNSSSGSAADKETIKDLEEQLQLINEELNEVMSENEKLKGSDASDRMRVQMFDKMKLELEGLTTKFQELEKENTELKKQSADTSNVDSTEVEGLREQLDILNEELNELMSENEKLRSKTSPQDMKVKMFDSLQKEFQEMGEKYTEAVKNVDSLKYEVELKDKEINSLKTNADKGKIEVEDVVKREQVRHVGKFTEVDSKEKEHLKVENEKLKQFLEQKSAMFDKLQTDLNSMNTEYSKIINDNTNMAKQIEELHQRLLKQGESQKDISIIKEERDHLEREKERLIQHILDLEKQIESNSNQSAQVNEELLRVEGELQQLVFDNNSLRSQLNLSNKDGKQASRFQTDYDQLQKQFNVAMSQKNQAQTENNQLIHRLQQRETRCQQLARQVSQLAEDRSYLNKQLANFSQALRGREQELGTLQQQYRVLYQSHGDLQAKLIAVEKSIASDNIEKASKAELAEVRVERSVEDKLEKQKNKSVQQTSEEIRMENKEFEARLADFAKVRAHLTENNERLEKTLLMEREQRMQTEESLAAVQARLRSIEVGDELKLDMGDDDYDLDRIREESPMLLRDDTSYMCRMMRWLRIQKEYYCISGRQITRLMRKRPGIRTMLWTYFVFLHFMIISCFFGFI